MLTKKEYATLDAIYKHRVTTSAQLGFLANRSRDGDEPSQTSVGRWLRNLNQQGLISYQRRDTSEKLWSITAAGVKALRRDSGAYGIPVARYEKQSWQISVCERSVTHHLHLNAMAISLIAALREIPGVTYEDEFDRQPSVAVRPDAIITIPGEVVDADGRTYSKTILYLESDMRTERKKAIDTKMSRYRAYFTSSSFDTTARHIIVFFCCDDTVNFNPFSLDEAAPSLDNKLKDAHHAAIKQTILSNIGDLLSSQIEAFVGSTRNVFCALCAFLSTNESKPGKLVQYLSADTLNLTVSLPKREFSRYTAWIEYPEFRKNFLVLDYCHERVGHFNLVLNHRNLTAGLRQYNRDDVILLIVLPNINSAELVASSCGLREYPHNDIMLSTEAALKNPGDVPFRQRMFKATADGMVMYNDTMTSFVRVELST